MGYNYSLLLKPRNNLCSELNILSDKNASKSQLYWKKLNATVTDFSDPQGSDIMI